MIRVHDNCNPPTEMEELNDRKANAGKNPSHHNSDKVKQDIRVTLGDFCKSSHNPKFSFFQDTDKSSYKNNDEELIIALTREKNKIIVQTGNYLGKFKLESLEIDIRSRFGDSFIKRMLNFANDVYLDDVNVYGQKATDLDFTQFILYHLFIQSLEKAYLLGIPKRYQNIQHHEMRLKGRLDINRHIKQDIPFLGKISSTSREMREVQEIVDVLYKAVTLIDDNANGITNNISHIKPHLKEAKSRQYVSQNTIAKAKACTALRNPIFSPYKKILRYAEYIIKHNSLQESNSKSKDQYFGFLVNVAELFEIYVTKLLQRAFIEWNVHSPKIELYETNLFFARKIIPDIVMARGDDILIFDTKYKRMNYKTRYESGGDLDRADFFQINTYMSYYQQQGKNVICGGLLYPLSQKFAQEKCHATHWLGNQKSRFIVDGVELSESGDNFIVAEEAFIGRIKTIINEYFIKQAA